MADTPEVKAKSRIKREMHKILESRGLPFKIHWNGGALVGNPRLDCDGVVAGHPFSIEVKRFDGKGRLRARQANDIYDYNKAGAFSLLVDSEESLAVFLGWLRMIEPRSEWGNEDEKE